MKKIFTFLFLLAITGSAFSQVIISQIYEGSSNNKFIEITNISSSSVNLASPQLTLKMFANKTDNSLAPTSIKNLTGTLNAGQSFVFRHGSAVRPAYAISYTPGDTAATCNFNGKGATANPTASTDIISIYNGATLVDVFSWGVFQYENKAYIRNATISAPNATWTLAEWTLVDTNAVNNAVAGTSERLGYHGSASTIPVTSITVSGAGSATTITTAAGTLQMSAAILPIDATNTTVTWSVTNGTGTATINSTGLLTAVSDGIVTVKATANDGSNVFGTLDITISNQPAVVLVTSITVTGAGSATTITTAAGTLQMSAAILPIDATNQTVTWSVTNGTGTATINSTGLLTAVSDGIVTAKATANDGSGIFGTLDITISNQPVVTGNTIYEIQYTTNVDGNSPYMDQVVTTSGIVTASYTGGYFIQDGVGAWNGVYVYDNTHTPALGDNITITALVAEYYTYTELKTVTAYAVNSTGNTLPAITAVTASSVKSEQYEGVLVKLTNAQCTYFHTSGWWKANQGTDTVEIGKLMYPFISPVIGTYYDVVGLVNYSFSAFKIEPRNASDISISSGINELDGNNTSRIYPNPARETITIKNLNNVNKIEIFNILGQVVTTYSNLKEEEVTLNLNGFNKGIYFISVIDNNRIVKTMKFTKE